MPEGLEEPQQLRFNYFNSRMILRALNREAFAERGLEGAIVPQLRRYVVSTQINLGAKKDRVPLFALLPEAVTNIETIQPFFPLAQYIPLELYTDLELLCSGEHPLAELLERAVAN